jgi:hypothetical protein
MNRKNQCGAVMAATLRLADVRLLAGVTLVVFPRCLIGRWQATERNAERRAAVEAHDAISTDLRAQVADQPQSLKVI